MSNFPETKLPLIEHLDELRARLIKCMMAVFFTTLASYAYARPILKWLIAPAGKVVFTAPPEAFVAHLEVAMFSGILLSSPVIIYQLWQFAATGLQPHERKIFYLYVPVSIFFFIMGTLLCYFLIIPISMKFLLGFALDNLVPMISVSKYISFVGVFCLMFGICFELPLVCLILTKMGILTPPFLIHYRKTAIVIIFIIAALVTPPDVITQCLLAVPLVLLYELGIIFSKLTYRNKELNTVSNN